MRMFVVKSPLNDDLEVDRVVVALSLDDDGRVERVGDATEQERVVEAAAGRQ